MNLRDFILGREKLIGAIIIIAVLAHMIFGKSRWQYYPIYLLAFLSVTLMLYVSFPSVNISRNLYRFFSISFIILSLTSIVFLLALPMEKLPKPRGKYLIGTKIYDLIDDSRSEIYSQNLNESRKIKIQVWYPADKVDGYKKAKWIGDGTILTRHLAKNMHMPFFMLDHTSLIDSNSYKDAPLSDHLDSYPLVLISHGWLGFRELHTDFGEELASNGYIGVSIDHTYGSQAVKFKDGSVAYLNPQALSGRGSSANFSNSSKRLVKTFGEDVISVINEMEDLNKYDRDFKSKLDLNRIGLLGHSTGGGGDVYVSLKDPRVKALLGLDAWVEPIEKLLLNKSLSIPSLFLRSSQWERGPNNRPLNALVEKSQDSTLIQIDKATHVDFSMAYMYSPLTKLVGFTGRLEGRQASEIQRDLILSFFDENLKERERSIIEIIDSYENARKIHTK